MRNHPTGRAGPSNDRRAPWFRALPARLFAPVDIASLVFFRVVFAAVMLWEVTRFFRHDWIRLYYIAPRFYFTFDGFGWVHPWPGAGMVWHFAVLAILAVFVMTGFAYRFSAGLFSLGFTYVFLLDQTRYLNHFYLICLVSMMLAFIPAHRALSVDAWLRPGLRSGTVPAWGLWLLRAQIGLVYFFGGVAKINPDWLRGEPLRTWLLRKSDMPIVGPLFAHEPVPLLLSTGGLLLDLLIVPFLLWRRTRWFAFGLALVFHGMNAQLFEIGIFPWLMIAATLMFFPPDWPRAALARLTGRGGRARSPRAKPREAVKPLTGAQKATVAVLAAYLAVQVAVPLRFLFIPGNPSWTMRGHYFSWRMKLEHKRVEARFMATDPATGETWEIPYLDYLTRGQTRAMVADPDMILQFAHHAAADLRRRGHARVQVHGDVRVALNGRAPQRLIDPAVDLALQPRSVWGDAPWILPLTSATASTGGGAPGDDAGP